MKRRLIIIICFVVLFAGCDSMTRSIVQDMVEVDKEQQFEEIKDSVKELNDTYDEDAGLAYEDVSTDGVSGLSSSKGVAYTDAEIPANVKKEVDSLNDEFISKIADGDINYLKSIVYPEYKDLLDYNNILLTYPSNITKDTEYNTMAQYLFVSETKGNSARSMTVSEDGTYIVSTAAITGESCISFILLEKQDNQLLLTTEFIREDMDENWYLRTIYLNDYSYYEKNIIEHYEIAKACNENGRPLSAFLILYGCSSTIRPSTLMQYNSEAEIIKFLQDIQKKISTEISFPMEFENLPGVILYGIDVKKVTDGYMPDFMYVTSLDINDTSESNLKLIEDEAYELHKAVMEMFPDMDKDFKAFLYGASMEIPESANAQYQRYGTIIHVD